MLSRAKNEWASVRISSRAPLTWVFITNHMQNYIIVVSFEILQWSDDWLFVVSTACLEFMQLYAIWCVHTDRLKMTLPLPFHDGAPITVVVSTVCPVSQSSTLHFFPVISCVIRCFAMECSLFSASLHLSSPDLPLSLSSFIALHHFENRQHSERHYYDYQTRRHTSTYRTCPHVFLAFSLSGNTFPLSTMNKFAHSIRSCEQRSGVCITVFSGSFVMFSPNWWDNRSESSLFRKGEKRYDV